jgi:hypothetical protein
MSTLKLDTIQHPDAAGAALTFDSDGTVTHNGGTLLTSVSDSSEFPSAILTSGNASLANTVAESAVAFHVISVNVDQEYPAGGGATVVQFGSVQLDSHSYWDASNHRYTPQIAGWYWFGGSVRFTTDAAEEGYVASEISKNGTGFTTSNLYSQFQVSSNIISNGMLPLSSGLIYLNGSTDYVNVTFRASTACTLSDLTTIVSHFSGHLVRKA